MSHYSYYLKKFFDKKVFHRKYIEEESDEIENVRDSLESIDNSNRRLCSIYNRQPWLRAKPNALANRNIRFSKRPLVLPDIMTIQSLFCSKDIKFRREIKIIDKQKQILSKRLFTLLKQIQNKRKANKRNERGHCHTILVFVKKATILKIRRSLLFWIRPLTCQCYYQIWLITYLLYIYINKQICHTHKKEEKEKHSILR